MFNINFFNFFTKFWEKLNLDIEKNVVIQTRNINKTGLFSFGVLRSRNFRHSKKSAAGQMAGTRVWNSTSSRHLAYQPKLRGSVENILPCVFALTSSTVEPILPIQRGIFIPDLAKSWDNGAPVTAVSCFELPRGQPLWARWAAVSSRVISTTFLKKSQIFVSKVPYWKLVYPVIQSIYYLNGRLIAQNLLNFIYFNLKY